MHTDTCQVCYCKQIYWGFFYCCSHKQAAPVITCYWLKKTVRLAYRSSERIINVRFCEGIFMSSTAVGGAKTVYGRCAIAVARRVGTFGPTATRHRNDHIPVRRATLDPLLLSLFFSFFLRKRIVSFFGGYLDTMEPTPSSSSYYSYSS